MSRMTIVYKAKRLQGLQLSTTQTPLKTTNTVTTRDRQMQRRPIASNLSIG